MNGTRVPVDRLVAPPVWISFALLIFPLAIGVVDTRLFSPLALPGYTVFVAMTVVGDVLPVVRNFGFRLYWLPFVVVCYGISVVVGIGYRALRRRDDA
ncbi:hypothetical protein [Halalkalicoccus sp. NIPERK01]|uniref:hypothetical protein n=1 Tax=Halalkalicoccus sp. NIPERK01 TaxID=3053469 RepID=UPI00256F1617|nr:hypothetical protein [Halalkalicoccus sp. NIPERK01]MDL5363325.1 hypothetical protein [Halalkalicoccus sp. NIPERK01]